MNDMEKSGNFKKSLIEYLDIFWTMFKIGVCTFGGGYAMVGILKREIAEKKQWISEEELIDYIAVAQITPGIIAVNCATFVGNKRKGIFGGILSTLGVVTPSIIIITFIAAVLTNFADNVWVQHAFAGIRIAVCVLIVNAAVSFIKKTVADVLTLITFICVFITAAFTSFQTIYIVLIVLAAGIVYTLVKGCRKK